MALEVTASGREASRKFKEAAQAQNADAAFEQLERLPLVDGLVSCLELAEKQRASFDALAKKATGKAKAQFVVRVANEGAIPGDTYSGISSDIEYHFIRIVILRARADKKRLTDALWGKAEDVATVCPFYPEKLKAFPDRRKRICEIARMHSALGPQNPRQAALFSLGGLYDYSKAMAGTHPSGAATTCLLFSRSVLHAAACNVIGQVTLRCACAVPKGPLAELSQTVYGYIPASELDLPTGKRPQAGDIFHIRGGPFPSGNDSSHLGVIVQVDGNTWSTVEGGGGDHVTRSKTRRLVEVKSTYGHWAFDDDATKAGTRPLQGWYSIDKISAQQWMD
jgi:hypothetical protein